jgi:hypothetical protein
VTDNASILTDAEMNNRRRVWSGYPFVKPSKDAVLLLISVDQDVRASQRPRVRAKAALVPAPPNNRTTSALVMPL